MNWLKKILTNKGLEFVFLALLGAIVVLAYYYFTSPPARTSSGSLLLPKLVIFGAALIALGYKVYITLRSGNNARTTGSRDSSTKSG